jgi:putative DNA primase/helicase
MSVFDEVLSRLQQTKKDGNWYSALCPVHEMSGNGHHASLRVMRATQVDDGVIVSCMAGCSRFDLQTELGLSSVTCKDTKDPGTYLFWNPSASANEIVASYDYTDENGVLLYQKVRFAPKKFVQRRPDGNGGWLWKLDDTRRVLYRLPEVAKAAGEGRTVFICEGEKAADAVRKLKFTATCASEGATKWKAEYAVSLKGTRCVVLPDNDEKGRKHGEIVIAALRRAGIPCCIVKLPGLPEKGDPYDAVQVGLTNAELRSLTEDSFARREQAATAEVYAANRAEFRLTEGGNAERFADQHKNLVASVPGRGMLAYSGGIFSSDKLALMRYARETVLSLYAEALDAETESKRRALAEHARRSDTNHARSGMITLAAAEESLEVPTSAFDADPELLCAMNGVVDLRSGTLKPHSPETRMTQKAGADYSGKVDCQVWLAHLERIFAGDHDLIQFVQRLFGYALTGYTREQIFSVFYGHGANGKSVTLHMIERALGDYARSAAAKTFTMSRHAEQRNDLARLEGARLVTTFETTAATTLDEEMIKQLTGGDRLVTRFLHQEFFEYTPQFLIIMSTNHKPMVEVADYAIKRRVMLVPFEVTIPEDEQDRDLERKLDAELSGILSWAVAGAAEYLADGLMIPRVVTEATEKAREELDPLHGFRDLITMEPGAWTSSAAVRSAVEKWAKDEGMKRIPADKELKPWLERLGATYLRRHGGARGWSGIVVEGQHSETSMEL